MPTTWTTEANSTPKSWITSTGAVASTFTFQSNVVSPTYTLDFLNFIGTFETLDTLWSLVPGNWGAL